jgi:hypothetical protein
MEKNKGREEKKSLAKNEEGEGGKLCKKLTMPSGPTSL